ncbi:MAG: hypothetical protein AB2L11_07950 [Syntrophobacteraceae bacterium]
MQNPFHLKVSAFDQSQRFFFRNYDAGPVSTQQTNPFSLFYYQCRAIQDCSIPVDFVAEENVN